MEESEDNITSESWIKADNNSAVKIKPKKRSLVERELETNLTARVTSPVMTGDGINTSRYGRARRLKTESEMSDSKKITLEVSQATQPEKSPNKLQSPVYKMHASNSPIRTISPKRTPVEVFLENQIETIYQENKSLSRFSTEEIVKNSPCKNQKIYIRKDLIQSREPEETVVLIKSIFSPSKGTDKIENTHLSNILERSSDNLQNGFIGNPSVVKTLDFDNKKKKKENKDIKYLSKSDLFELEAKCMYQVGDLAWSRMGTYPFWPCIVTRDPTTGIYVKKKLFGRVERDIIHVTFFGDNGRRGWILDSMLRKFMGLAEFESTRDKFTAEDKKKDPRLYAAFFISDKKQALWHISVEEAETLMREPKRLRTELLNDILENSRSYKINPKSQKSGKVTRTDSDVSLSESLYDTLFSEDDGKTDDSERSKNKSRNKSLDVSEVVTACLDNMAAKTGITKIQRQSHMDRWLQKAKSNTPEKTHVKAQIPRIIVDNNVYNSKKKKLHREVKPYNLRKYPNESHNLLSCHNEHDYSKFVSDDDNSSVKTSISDGNIENKYEFGPLEESGAGIGVITKIESLADSKEQSNIVEAIKDDDFMVTSNKYDKNVVFESGVTTLTEKETQNIGSDKVNMVQDKKKDINDYNSDDQEVSVYAILKENESSCLTNCIETDSTFISNSCLENPGSISFTENSEDNNENPMAIDSIINDINDSSAILDKNNLSINKRNVSMVDTEMSIGNENHGILTKNPNLYPEESNDIPLNNNINFRTEESHDSVAADIQIEKESTANTGDNIVLDLKSLRKDNCDEVNINTEDSFLYQTESVFLHSIKSRHEDNLEDTNNINKNNISEETKMNIRSHSNLVSKENIINNANIYYDNNEIDITKSLHLDRQSYNFEADKVDDDIKNTQELCENDTNIQQEKKEKENNIVQEINENMNLESNKSTSNNLDVNEDILSQSCYPNFSKNDSVDFDYSDNALITLADIKLASIGGNPKDTNCKEKIEMQPDEFLKINGFQKTEIKKSTLVDSNTIDSMLIESHNEINLNKDSFGNLRNTIRLENIEINTQESPNLLHINGFQETETNNLEENNEGIDNNFINTEVSDMLSKKYHLRSENKQKRMNECNNLDFLKYLELRKDVVIDEHPELDEDKIITYLYQTWLYEENRKADIKKTCSLEESSSVKGLDNPNLKKRSRRLKAERQVNTEGKKNKSTTERIDKELDSESVTSESSQNSVKSGVHSKWPLVMLQRNLSLKRNYRMIPSPIGDLSDTKVDNITVNISKNNESNIEISCNTQLEISMKPKYDNVNHDIGQKESEIMCSLVDSIDKDKLHPILFSLLSDSMPNALNNVSEITNEVTKDLQDETSSVDTEASDVPLIYQKISIKAKENISNENKSPKTMKEEFESKESIDSMDMVTSLNKSKDKLTYDEETNTLNKSPETKEESENNNDSFNSTDSETTLTIPEQKSKRDRETANALDENLETKIKENESKNNSLNVINLETSLIKPKQKNKYYKKSINPFDDPEFQKYIELRQDSLIEENPQLTQEDIKNYLYKTWLYEENNKSDLKKTDELAQSTLVKGLEQETVAPKKIKKKVKVPREITDYFDVSPKEKPKRKTIKPYYNEDYYDIEDEIECFEINRDSDCSSSNKTEIEQTQQRNNKPMEVSQGAYEIEVQEEIDEVEIYFFELTKPKPNIFKGLLREKVCEICEKAGNLVKCKNCHGMFHVDCVQTESKVVEITTPMRGRKKKKKAGRKPKSSEDSEGHSDDKHDISDNNISIEEIETESITVDAVTLEKQLYEKMKELLENTEAINYDSYSSDNELDWNDTTTGKCEIVNVQLKRKSSDTYVDYSDFKCNHCKKDDTPVCFVCKSDISKNESKLRQRCQVPHCHRYYHLECLDHWPQTQFNAGEPSKYNKKVNVHFESLICPRHVCHTCVSDDPRGCKTRFSGDKLARCIRCPATYHTFTKCVPAGSQILTASHIICPRHYKHRPGKVPCHVNTGWCFICALGGSLICCEYCPTSFHAECLNIDPPEGGYMCEDCETGRLPLYGEMVWVKLGHYRWWPGLILHPSEIPQNIMAVKHSQGEFVVRFFGQYDYYWVNRGRVFPFQEGDSGRISSQKSKIDAAFTTAMEHAQRACEVLKSAMPNDEESMDIASSLLPPHYVKLKVNKPCGSLCGRKLDDPELSLTQCDCNPDEEDPCGPYSQCLNRMLLTECGPSCRAGDRCNNRAFEKRLYPKLVPYRTPHRGWGLKTLEVIKAGQFVIEYVGELIDEEEFKRRMSRKHEIRDENFYFLTLDKERMIDAGPKGNLARFMNHCCEPNCETQKWTVLGDVRVGLFALYDIPANSEVTFNYNLESAGIEKKRCLCGAKRCSGYIGAKPKQDESQSKKGGKVPVKRAYKKRKTEESSPSTGKTKTKRLGRPPKPKELSEIEKDLLIIRNATSCISSDDSSRSLSSECDRLPKALKRKRVSFSTESSESQSMKRQKYNEKDVGD